MSDCLRIALARVLRTNEIRRDPNILRGGMRVLVLLRAGSRRRFHRD